MTMPPSVINVQKDPFLTHTEKLEQGNPAANPYLSQPPPRQKPARHSAQIWLQSSVLPFTIFTTLLLLFTFMYHKHPVVPWILVFLSVDLAIFGCWPPRSDRGGRAASDWALMAFCLFAVLAGTIAGLVCYEVISPWVHIRYLQHYSGVRPGGDPRAYSDAGVLSFSSDSRLDPSSSAGFEEWPVRYCAAPVVSVDHTEAATFWAVGVNCCDKRGGFWCGASETSHATPLSPKLGVRILPAFNLGKRILLGHDHGEQFRRAVKMAAGAYGFRAPREPIIVDWVTDVESEATRAWWIAVFHVLVATAGAAVASLACGQMAVKAYHHM